MACRYPRSNGKEYLSVALLSERPHAVQHEALEVLGRDVSVPSRAISVLLPQSKNVCLLLASSDVKGYDALLLARGVAQFSQNRLGPVRVFGSEGEPA